MIRRCQDCNAHEAIPDGSRCRDCLNAYLRETRTVTVSPWVAAAKANRLPGKVYAR